MAGHGLQLTDLDDYLLPSQECVLPETVPSGEKKLDIVVEDGVTYEVGTDGTKKKLESASISLADCLACSGCVTSAESLLVSQQSKEEFLKQVKAGDHALIVSISPHARASLAAWTGLTPMQVQKRLRTFFKGLGAHLVLDSAFAHEIEVHERCLEFVERYTAANSSQSQSSIPLVESTCPGWICYAEKTQSFVIPLLSRVKSAQQILGTLVKDYYGPKMGLSRAQIFHCAIAPCHDKKLEASRPDFQDADGVRDVDTVLVASELRDLLMDQGVDLTSLHETESEQPEVFPVSVPSDYGYACNPMQSKWGGCMEQVFSHAAATLFPDLAGSGNLAVQLKAGRNKDSYEYQLRDKTGMSKKALLRFSAQYGFRNLQNVVRKLKVGKAAAPFDFVEAMACPGACLNGGGQIPPVPPMQYKDLTEKVRESYETEVQSETPVPMKDENEDEGDGFTPQQHALSQEVLGVYKDIGGRPGSEIMFWTQYHAVMKSDKVNPAFIRW